jgi:hypothetical protein
VLLTVRQEDRMNGSDPTATEQARIFCLVAHERAEELLDPLREHFAGEPQVAVLVERRSRAGKRLTPPPPAEPHQRRAPVAERDPVRAVPAELEPEHVRIVQPLETVRRVHEATDLHELVERSIATEPDAVSELWWRIGERVMARLRLQVGPFVAEGAMSRLMGRILDELPDYDPQREPLSHWLDAVVDRYAIDYHVT